MAVLGENYRRVMVAQRAVVMTSIFFFQAEDGIRDYKVTGVQTCALPISGRAAAQFDFAGSWAPIGTEDVQNDSVPVDYLGLALTDEARARALSYDESQK